MIEGTVGLAIIIRITPGTVCPDVIRIISSRKLFCHLKSAGISDGVLIDNDNLQF